MSKRCVPLHPRCRQRARTATIGVAWAIAATLAPLPGHPGAVAAQDPAAPTGQFTLRGTIRDASDAPIAAAVVSVFGLPGASTTNEKGEFSLSGLPGGTRVVQVVALGYKPRAVATAISSGTPPLTVALQKANVILDSMQVVAKRLTQDATKRPTDRITEKELASPDIISINALEAFALLRPQLFAGRPSGNGMATTSAAERGRLFIRDNAGSDDPNRRPTCVGNRACDIDGRLSVSINEGPLGSPDILTAIPTRIIREMRYLQAMEATARFGMLAGSGPVLIVYTK
jgi:Carboxypeptidase regulatory-like domain